MKRGYESQDSKEALGVLKFKKEQQVPDWDDLPATRKKTARANRTKMLNRTFRRPRVLSGMAGSALFG